MTPTPMSGTLTRRYVVTGEGITASGDTREEALARFRRHRSNGERRISESIRIPVDRQLAFDGERFFEALDTVQTVPRHH